MWFMMMRAGYKFKLVPEPLLKWRLHPSQGVQAIKDICYREQEELYIWAFDLFRDEVASYSYMKIFGIARGLRGYSKVKASDHVLRSRYPTLYPLSKTFCVLLANPMLTAVKTFVLRIEKTVSTILSKIGLGLIVKFYRAIFYHKLKR